MAMLLDVAPIECAVDHVIEDVSKYSNNLRSSFLILVGKEVLQNLFGGCANTECRVLEASNDINTLSFAFGKEYDRIYVLTRISETQLRFLLSRLKNPRSTCPKHMFVIDDEDTL